MGVNPPVTLRHPSCYLNVARRLGETIMTTTARVIEALWIRIQEEFLNNPTATFTAEQLRQRVAADSLFCDAVLDALVDSGVTERTLRGYRLAVPELLAA
jgi:hypothetical protein